MYEIVAAKLNLLNIFHFLQNTIFCTSFITWINILSKLRISFNKLLVVLAICLRSHEFELSYLWAEFTQIGREDKQMHLHAVFLRRRIYVDTSCDLKTRHLCLCQSFLTFVALNIQVICWKLNTAILGDNKQPRGCKCRVPAGKASRHPDHFENRGYF